jgi:phage host-nuclease inhibitor protein Gam
MAKKKLNAADIRVPQSRDEAAEMIAELGRHDRAVQMIEAAMNDALAKLKADAAERAKDHEIKAKALMQGLLLYCTANRDALTDNGKTKTIDFLTGTAAWRFKPASVRISGGEEDLIKLIADKGGDYLNFLRQKTEIDRDAMLKNKELARTLAGVTIGSGGETFTVEPFAQETVAPQIAAPTLLPEVTP